MASRQADGTRARWGQVEGNWPTGSRSRVTHSSSPHRSRPRSGSGSRAFNGSAGIDGLSLQPPATSSASNDDVSNQLFAIAQFLNGRLGPNTVAVATLTSDLADGVVFAKVAALTRPALADLCPQSTSPRGSSSSADGTDSGSSALRPEVNPSRRREQLVRLIEAFRAAGVCPLSCMKPSEASRVANHLASGHAPTVVDFTFGLLLQLQLHRLATASRALPARLATAAHAGCLGGGLPGAAPSSAASGGVMGGGGIGSGMGAGGGVGSNNNANLIGVRLGSVSDLQKHLLAWCTHLAAAQGVKVWNLNSSLQDGKALLAVLHGLDPFLWPYDPLVAAPPGKKFSELKALNLGLALRRAANPPLRVPNCISPALAHAVALGLTAGRGATVAAARAHDALHESATTLYLSELLVQGARLAHRRDAAACSLQRIYSRCRGRRSGDKRQPTLKDGAPPPAAGANGGPEEAAKQGAQRRGLSSGQSDDLWIAELDAVSPVQRVSRHHPNRRGNGNNQGGGGGGGGGVDKGSVIEDSVLDVMDDSALVPMDEPTLMGVSLRREASTSAAFIPEAAPPNQQQQPQRRLQLAPVPEPLSHGYSSSRNGGGGGGGPGSSNGGSRSNNSTPRSSNNVRVDDKTAPAGHGNKGGNRLQTNNSNSNSAGGPNADSPTKPHETGTVFEAEKALWLDGLTREFRLADKTGAGTLPSEVVFEGLRGSTPGASKEDLLDLINDWRLPDGRVMYMNMIASLKSHTPSKAGGSNRGSNSRDFMAGGFDPNAQPDDDDDDNGTFDDEGRNNNRPHQDEEVIAGLYKGLSGSNHGDDDDDDDADGAEHAFRVDDDGQEGEEEEVLLQHSSGSRGMAEHGTRVAPPPPPPRNGYASPPLSPRRFDSNPSVTGSGTAAASGAAAGGVGARAGKGGEAGPGVGLARQGWPRLGSQQRPAGSAPRPTTAYRSMSSPNVTSPTDGGTTATSAAAAARAEAAVQAQRQKFAPRRVSGGVGFPGNRGERDRGGGSPVSHPDDAIEAAAGQGGGSSSRPSASAARDRGASLKEAALDRVAAAERQATNRAVHHARSAAGSTGATVESEELAALRSQVAQLTAQQKDVAELQRAAANLQAAHDQLQRDHDAALQRHQQQQLEAEMAHKRDADARARAEASAASAAEAQANAERRATQAAARAEEAAAAAATSAASAGFAPQHGQHHAGVPPPPPARPSGSSAAPPVKQGEWPPRRHCSAAEGGRYISPLVAMTGTQVAAWAKRVGILGESNRSNAESDGLAALAAGEIDGRALAFLADGAVANIPSASGHDSSSAATATAPWEYLKYLRSELGLPAPLALRFAFELDALASLSSTSSADVPPFPTGAKVKDAASEPQREAPVMSYENDDDEVEDGDVEGGGDPPSPTRRAAARDAVIGGAEYGNDYGNSHNDNNDGNAHLVGGKRQASQGGDANVEPAARGAPAVAGRGEEGPTAPNRPAPSSPRQPRSRQPNPTPPSAVRALFRGGDVY